MNHTKIRKKNVIIDVQRQHKWREREKERDRQTEKKGRGKEAKILDLQVEFGILA